MKCIFRLKLRKVIKAAPLKLLFAQNFKFLENILPSRNKLFSYYFRYVSSWIDTREVQSEKANLQILFDKYVPICLDTLRVRFKKITPVPDITMVTTLCYLLECLLNPTNTPPDCNKELYELYFVFAAVWAFGGAMFQDQVCFIDGFTQNCGPWKVVKFY